MKQNTSGNLIYEMIPNCHCGLTSGCENCNPTSLKYIGVPFFQKINKEKWTTPLTPPEITLTSN